MPPRGFTNDDANGKEFAVKKYRRQRTLVKKMLELSKMGLKINMIIYNPRFHRMEEIWSHEDIKIEDVKQLLDEPNNINPQMRRGHQIKFESHNAT